MRVKRCTRHKNHPGPCNGYPASTCSVFAALEGLVFTKGPSLSSQPGLFQHIVEEIVHTSTNPRIIALGDAMAVANKKANESCRAGDFVMADAFRKVRDAVEDLIIEERKKEVPGEEK